MTGNLLDTSAALLLLTFPERLLQPKHVTELLQLPPRHHDPFDRALLAQAAAEELVLVTTDTGLRGYESDRVQILI